MQTVASLTTRLKPWLQQTSTIIGLSTLLGVLVSVLTGELTWLGALPIAVSALVAMLLPGQASASTLAGKIVLEAVAATNPATRAAALQQLSKDVPHVVTIILGPEKVVASPEL